MKETKFRYTDFEIRVTNSRMMPNYKLLIYKSANQRRVKLLNKKTCKEMIKDIERII